jgi:hypothetical protein
VVGIYCLALCLAVLVVLVCLSAKHVSDGEDGGNANWVLGVGRELREGFWLLGYACVQADGGSPAWGRDVLFFVRVRPSWDEVVFSDEL